MANPMSTATGAQRILIIEDEPDITEVLKYNLEKNHYQVATAGTGEDGLAAARDTLPDLVLLDLMLPGIDGLEVCRKIREDPRTRDLLECPLRRDRAEVSGDLGHECAVARLHIRRQCLAVRQRLRVGDCLRADGFQDCVRGQREVHPLLTVNGAVSPGRAVPPKLR